MQEKSTKFGVFLHMCPKEMWDGHNWCAMIGGNERGSVFAKATPRQVVGGRRFSSAPPSRAGLCAETSIVVTLRPGLPLSRHRYGSLYARLTARRKGAAPNGRGWKHSRTVTQTYAVGMHGADVSCGSMPDETCCLCAGRHGYIRAITMATQGRAPGGSLGGAPHLH